MRKIDVQDFHRATRDTTREVNRRIILNLLRDHGPMSRAQLARTMEVPRGMITSLVRKLLSEELVYEGATTEAPRGRKPTLLHLRNTNRLAVGVDLRARETVLVLSDFGGEEVGTLTVPTEMDPTRAADRLASAVEEIVQRHGGARACEGVGVVVPGMVDTERGTVLNAPALGWKEVGLGTALQERLGMPVWLDRDAIACAMAWMWMVGPRKAAGRDFVYLIASEGVGVAIVVDGDVVRGHHYTAGEFGHIPIDLGGPRCSCGSRGCLEAHTSDSATVNRYLAAREVAEPGRPQDGYVGIDEVVAAAAAGCPAARDALRTTGRYLGVGMSAVVNGLNPARIIVGGGITAGWGVVHPMIRAELEERALTPQAAATPVTVDEEYPATRLRGAVALVVAPAFAAPRLG